MDVIEKLVELLNNSFAEQYEKRGLLTAPHTATDLIAHGVTVQEWISVKDRLPENDGRYLVYDGDTGNYYDSYYDETEGEFGEWQNCFDPFTLGVIDCEWNSCPNVTHWMPLPPAPKGE